MSYQRRKVLAALKRLGFVVLREGGSHTIVSRDADGVRIAVPRHKELQRGTVRGMADDAGANWDQFRKDVS